MEIQCRENFLKSFFLLLQTILKDSVYEIASMFHYKGEVTQNTMTYNINILPITISGLQ